MRQKERDKGEDTSNVACHKGAVLNPTQDKHQGQCLTNTRNVVVSTMFMQHMIEVCG